MLRHWLQILLVSLLVLLQTACPKYRTTPPEELKLHDSEPYRGGD